MKLLTTLKTSKQVNHETNILENRDQEAIWSEVYKYIGDHFYTYPAVIATKYRQQHKFKYSTGSYLST